ncbi:hypothetical protein O159_20520 [Leifsonia xyli subsp. cynodontis DSM 46306]|uniref:Uncharacterized protein n=1 Tax=Leifsonia xyli subsp. cynodontis DSM 46306 TaxID=1389489 RepID=U3PBD1_LEIXC|nr:hypothetical protein O159_20520 [Leifsonia xyli subsp. cynodontis DSM 46306]
MGSLDVVAAFAGDDEVGVFQRCGEFDAVSDLCGAGGDGGAPEQQAESGAACRSGAGELALREGGGMGAGRGVA